MIKKFIYLSLSVFHILNIFSVLTGQYCYAGVFSSGAIAPIGKTRINMRSIEVKIKLKKDSFTVDSVFKLYNPGDTVKQGVKLPKKGEYPGIDFIYYDLWVEGEKVKLREEYAEGLVWGYVRQRWLAPIDYESQRDLALKMPGVWISAMKLDRWLVTKVIFESQNTTNVRCKYESKYYPTVYILGTANGWSGVIGKTNVYIDGSILRESYDLSVRILDAGKLTNKIG